MVGIDGDKIGDACEVERGDCTSSIIAAGAFVTYNFLGRCIVAALQI